MSNNISPAQTRRILFDLSVIFIVALSALIYLQEESLLEPSFTTEDVSAEFFTNILQSSDTSHEKFDAGAFLVIDAAGCISAQLKLLDKVRQFSEHEKDRTLQRIIVHNTTDAPIERTRYHALMLRKISGLNPDMFYYTDQAYYQNGAQINVSSAFLDNGKIERVTEILPMNSSLPSDS